MSEIQVNSEGMAQFPLERGRWVAYPATDWAEADDDQNVYVMEGDELNSLMRGREMSLKGGDRDTARDFERQIEELLAKSRQSR